MKNLHNSKDEILTRLRTVQPTSQRCWGKMSAHQMVCHLADSLRGPMGQRSISRRSPPLPRKLIKWLALNLPMRWPHGVKGPPEIDQQLGGTRPEEFTADMRQLLHAGRIHLATTSFQLGPAPGLRRHDGRRMDALGLPSHRPSSTAIWSVSQIIRAERPPALKESARWGPSRLWQVACRVVLRPLQ